jgi:hypothetical protein
MAYAAPFCAVCFAPNICSSPPSADDLHVVLLGARRFRQDLWCWLRGIPSLLPPSLAAASQHRLRTEITAMATLLSDTVLVPVSPV